MPSSIRTSFNILETKDKKAKERELDHLIKDFEENNHESLNRYLKASRSDAYLLIPEKSVSSATTAIEKLREIAHIIRPLVYICGYLMTKDRRLRWSAWALSLALEIFANWPQIIETIFKKTGHAKKSAIEHGEEHSRLLQLALFLLREPCYSSYTRSYLNGLKASLGEWRLLKPIVDTAETYQKLWETVYFYTSSS
jgi:hypothetical protein